MGGFTDPTDPDQDDLEAILEPDEPAELVPDAEREVPEDDVEEYGTDYDVGAGSDTTGEGLGEGLPGI